MNPRQCRPATARRIAASVRAAIKRKKQQAEEDRRAVLEAGIRMGAAQPTKAEILRAHQKLNRKKFVAFLQGSIPVAARGIDSVSKIVRTPD